MECPLETDGAGGGPVILRYHTIHTIRSLTIQPPSVLPRPLPLPLFFSPTSTSLSVSPSFCCSFPLLFTLSDCWSWACTYKAELGPDSRVSRDRPLIHRHIARRINTRIFVHLQPATSLQIVLLAARPSFYPTRRCLSHHFTDYDFESSQHC
jgi:hypothetical protein